MGANDKHIRDMSRANQPEEAGQANWGLGDPVVGLEAPRPTPLLALGELTRAQVSGGSGQSNEDRNNTPNKDRNHQPQLGRPSHTRWL